MSRTAHAKTGFGQASDTFTIAASADGSAVDPVDLGRNFAFIRLYCADCSNIPSTTTLSIQIGFTDSDTIADAKDPDSWATWVSPGNLPTTGTFTVILPADVVLGAQRIRLIMSNNASGGSVVFTVYGFDQGVDD